ncbi:MAG TPA: C2 family cysteine protease [Candidatus Obscuribacterales bacterium]
MSTLRTLEKLDKTHNGLTAQELRTVDIDNDGALSVAEAKTAGLAEADRALLNRRLTGNLPATAFVFTRSEMESLKVLAPLQTHFDEIDEDHNQLLSASEMAAARGNAHYKGEEAAAMAAVFKNLSELQLLSDDTKILPKLPQNKYLDKFPLQSYDERGLSRKDMERFLELTGKGNSAVSSTVGSFSMVLYSANSAKAPIFANGLESIRFDNVQQGELGDCYFISAVAALANTPKGKQQIQNMIKEIGNDYVTVTFPGKLPVTISRPTEGELSMYASTGNDGMWLPILEKAYAKLKNDNPMLLSKANPYDMIGSGGLLMSGVGVVTGKSTDTDLLMLTSTSTLRKKLTEAARDKRVMTTGTNGSLNPWGKKETDNGLPKGHAYSVLDFDPKTDMVTVRNPWGNTEVSDGHGPRDGVDDGVFKMPLSEFKSTFDMICYQEK